MNTTPKMTESNLFSSAFSTLKAHYALCLGMSLLVLLVTVICGAVQLIMGISFSSMDALYPGVIAAIISQFALYVFILTPVTMALAFKVVSRIRNEHGMRKGWFPRVLKLSFIAHLILLPGLICTQFGNPGSFERLKLIPSTIELLVLEAQEKSRTQQLSNEIDTRNPPSAETQTDPEKEKKLARLRATKDELARLKGKESQLLTVLGALLSILGLVYIVTRLPWAAFAASDPREECLSLSETLRRGANLGSGSKLGLIASYVCVLIIAIIGLGACLVPGIFFGFPLAFAWMPASYLLLRDRKGEAKPAAPA